MRPKTLEEMLFNRISIKTVDQSMHYGTLTEIHPHGFLIETHQNTKFFPYFSIIHISVDD
jgi:hypothetical protein